MYNALNAQLPQGPQLRTLSITGVTFYRPPLNGIGLPVSNYSVLPPSVPPVPPPIPNQVPSGPIAARVPPEMNTIHQTKAVVPAMAPGLRFFPPRAPPPVAVNVPPQQNMSHPQRPQAPVPSRQPGVAGVKIGEAGFATALEVAQVMVALEAVRREERETELKLNQQRTRRRILEDKVKFFRRLSGGQTLPGRERGAQLRIQGAVPAAGNNVALSGGGGNSSTSIDNRIREDVPAAALSASGSNSNDSDNNDHLPPPPPYSMLPPEDATISTGSAGNAH